MSTILITEQIDPVGVSLLKQAGHTVVWMQGRTQEELAEKLKDAEAVIVRILEIPAEIIHSAPKLKLISKHGVGVDNIDLDAAKKAGVAVTITPGANSLSVAEHTIALLLSLAKNLPYTTEQYKAKGFSAKNSSAGIEVSGKTLGIIGCGRIGSLVAKIAVNGFSMRVLAYDPYITEVPKGVELVSDRDRIFRESDFITLHPVLTEETHHSVGAHEFQLMKPTAFLLNCGRGPLIREEVMIEALQNGKIAGAGLDVTEKEPCDPDSPLFQMSNVILTPHFAPTTHEASSRVSRIAAENVVHFLSGNDVVGRIV